MAIPSVTVRGLFKRQDCDWELFPAEVLSRGRADPPLCCQTMGNDVVPGTSAIWGILPPLGLVVALLRAWLLFWQAHNIDLE